MLQRGFLKREKDEPKQGRSIKTASSIMLYVGVIIVIASLGYLLMNIERVDAIIMILMTVCVKHWFIVL